MSKKGPLWWRESDWLLRGSSAANQILLRHSGPILSNINYLKLRSADCRENPTVTVGTTAGFLAVTLVVYSLSDILTDPVVCVKLLSSQKN